MNEYKVEFDVTHWQYVLRLGGETILLGKQDVREANWLAHMIIDGRKYNNDRGIGNGNPAYN